MSLTLLLSRSLHYKALKYEKLKKYLHPQHHLQTINITEVDQAYMEQEIK